MWQPKLFSAAEIFGYVHKIIELYGLEMGLLTLHFEGGIFMQIVCPGDRVSSAAKSCPGGMVTDETDGCITSDNQPKAMKTK